MLISIRCYGLSKYVCVYMFLSFSSHSSIMLVSWIRIFHPYRSNFFDILRFNVDKRIQIIIDTFLDRTFCMLIFDANNNNNNIDKITLNNLTDAICFYLTVLFVRSLLKKKRKKINCQGGEKFMVILKQSLVLLISVEISIVKLN